jgi:histidinol-phosphatase (PHP family)
MRADLHTHSRNSFDGYPQISEMCESAIEKGIEVLCVSEHWDAMATMPSGYSLNGAGGKAFFGEETYRVEFLSAKEKYGKKIKLLYGIELGQPSQNPEGSRALLVRQPFDTVNGSIHNLRNDRDLIDVLTGCQTYEAVDKTVREYLDLTRALVDFGGVNVLCHFDYPLRYIPDFPGYERTLLPYRDQIADILRAAACKGMALELNTAGLKKLTKAINPEPWIIRLYKDLGGQYVSIGSDAHRACDIGFGIDAAAGLAKRCGISRGAYFEGGQPRVFSL